MTALLLIPYVIAGLFISRWWWRLDRLKDHDAQTFTFAIFMFWPFFLVGMALFSFVRWFYSQPSRKRS